MIDLGMHLGREQRRHRLPHSDSRPLADNYTKSTRMTSDRPKAGFNEVEPRVHPSVQTESGQVLYDAAKCYNFGSYTYHGRE